MAAGAVAGFYIVKAFSWIGKLYTTWAYWRVCSIPGPPRIDPITGHARYLTDKKAFEHLARFAEKYGPIYKLQLLNNLAVVVSDPVAMAQCTKRGSGYLHKAHELYAALEIGTTPRTHNILTDPTDGPQWKAVRQATSSCFSPSSLRQTLPWLLQLCERSAERIEAQGPEALVDAAQVSSRITSDVMGKLLFNEDLGGVSQRPSEYLSVFQGMLAAMHDSCVNPLRGVAALWCKRVAAENAAAARHNTLIEQMLRRVLAAPPPDYTIAAQLLRVKDPDSGRGLSKARLKGEMAAFMGAGFETTSHGIAWALGALAAHPDIQSKLVEELAAAGLVATPQRPRPRQFTYADSGRLPYAAAVISETLRMFPPAPLGSHRVTAQDTIICGHAVPQGTLVMFPIFVIGHSKRVFGEDAEQFRPERWLEAGGGADAGGAARASGRSGRRGRSGGGAPVAESVDSDGGGSAGSWEHVGAEEEGQEPAADGAQGGGGGDAGGAPGMRGRLPPDGLAFSMGPRDCAGQALAKLEMLASLVVLVGRLQLRLAPQVGGWEGLLARRTCTVTLHAAGGVQLLATPRASLSP